MGTTLRASPVQAYFLQPCQRPTPEQPKHFLGSFEELEEACPQCARPLQLLLSLDASDGRIGLPVLPGNQLKLCVCGVCHQLQYAIAANGEIATFPISRASSPNSETILTPPKFSPVALHAVPDRVVEARTLASEGRLDEAGIWVREFDWAIPSHQVGGRPLIRNGKFPSPICPLCNTAPPFLASVVCGIAGPTVREELEQAQVLFFFCQSCPVVLAIASHFLAIE